ncbi:hypothetical protein [Thermococcus sp.]|uniref:hypothetical protein n=1 Tax=Thermococcus sp. TaxID=35749 RepID=UPI0026097D8A|nr:hypothetical protein [Thermococcus sp.]
MPMKKVEAIIRAEDFNRVKSALKQIGSRSRPTPSREGGFREEYRPTISSRR